MLQRISNLSLPVKSIIFFESPISISPPMIPRDGGGAGVGGRFSADNPVVNKVFIEGLVEISPNPKSVVCCGVKRSK